VVGGCGILDSCLYEEVSRETSTDGLVDALIMKINCGATTDYSYKVYIVPKGTKPNENHVYLSDKTNSLEISWVAPKSLLITYDNARIFEYTNFWQSKNVENFKYIVSITESRKSCN